MQTQTELVIEFTTTFICQRCLIDMFFERVTLFHVILYMVHQNVSNCFISCNLLKKYTNIASHALIIKFRYIILRKLYHTLNYNRKKLLSWLYIIYNIMNRFDVSYQYVIYTCIVITSIYIQQLVIYRKGHFKRKVRGIFDARREILNW